MSVLFQTLYFGVGVYVATMSYIILDKIEGKSSNLRRSVEGLAAIGTFMIGLSLSFFVLRTQCNLDCRTAAISRVPTNSFIIVIIGVPLVILTGILMKEAKTIDETLKLKSQAMMAVVGTFTGTGLALGFWTLFSRNKATKAIAQLNSTARSEALG